MPANHPAPNNISLIVTCHPSPGSLCGHIAQRVIAALQECGATVRVNDLHGTHFNPVPSDREFQTYLDPEVPDDIRDLVTDLRSARELIFILPIWMFTMPAILKGYFDRVWRPHVAFSFDGRDLSPLLSGIERMTVIATHGRDKAETDQDGDGSRLFFATSVTTLLPNLKSNERFDFYALDTTDRKAVEDELDRVVQHLNRQNSP